MGQRQVSIGKAADLLGVHVDTLREWDNEGKLTPVKTLGNHRRYNLDEIEALCGNKPKKPKSEFIRVACYARVSSHEQKAKGDLERQAGRILTYCTEKQYHVVKSYQEVGSGMSDTRPKLRQLFKLIEERKIDKVVVEHKDRLTRFNFQFLADFFDSHDVEIEWVSEVLGNKSYEQELVEDMLTLMSSFSNKIYGKRSAENRKKKKELEQMAVAATTSQSSA
jgi:putative resolvase